MHFIRKDLLIFQYGIVLGESSIRQAPDIPPMLTSLMQFGKIPLTRDNTCKSASSSCRRTLSASAACSCGSLSW
ncbi:hypothetical protein L798_14030 [Zootermopsis nevadensis]|uniref:Uncharacterized protein n=1 Tax=Zootermopsis nevadensis TaxID=136037 RepID=A0A067R1D6_ZOONE|nr:hypothetical protein L798_14030 [Zootermopsis nevadensis]